MRQIFSAGLIAALSIGGSVAFACAAPFAAISALAAARMDRSIGLLLVTLAWLSNQMIGFAILGYPLTAGSLAWGIAIGLAAVLAFIGSRMASVWTRRHYFGLAPLFASSFTIYELTLYLAAAGLSASSDAFSARTVIRVFEINLVSFAAALLLQWLARTATSHAEQNASTG